MDKNKDAIDRIRVAVPKFRPTNEPLLAPAASQAANPTKQTAAEAFDTSTEKRMMDAILGPSRAVGGSSASSAANGPAATAASNSSLVGTMAQRLQQLEAAQANFRNELVAKDRELLAARRQIETAMSEASAAREALAASRGDALAQERVQRREAMMARDMDALQAENNRLGVENSRLRHRVGAMESFLSDYGLVWVGEGDESDDEAPADDDADNAGQGGAAAAAVDFSLMKLRLAQLNKLAGEGKSVVVERNGAHVFEQQKGLPLTLYQDGIMLGRGPFRSFGTSLADAFVADVCDGYFPYELKETYPNGVVFEVHDKSGECFNSNCSGNKAAGAAAAAPRAGDTSPAEDAKGAGFVAFSGEGRSLASAGSPAHGVTPTGRAKLAATANNSNNGRPSSRMDTRVASFAAMGDGVMQLEDLSAPMPAEKLLAALPAKAIAGGNVVDVRATVAKALGQPVEQPARAVSQGRASDRAVAGQLLQNQNGVVLADTPVIRLLRAKATEAAVSDGHDAAPGLDMANVATLQVKLDASAAASGTRVLLVKLTSDDTIADVRRYVDAARPAGAPAYELRTAAPPRAYSDPAQTLKQAGLVPTATLIVRVTA